MNLSTENRYISLFVLLLCLYWSYSLLLTHNSWIFLDGVTLLFHEAGHLLLMFGPEFLMMLGGTLFQVLIPMLIIFQFWQTQQNFGVGFGIWWLGENLINIGWYMADAQERTLETIGSGHDWHWIFSQLGVLKYDNLIGGSILVVGTLTLGLGLGLMVYRLILSFNQ